jgi:hypothetical protein
MLSCWPAVTSRTLRRSSGPTPSIMRSGTLDALQLSAALDLRRRGAVSELVASDRNLCTVATLEGLSVINPLT